MKNFYCKLLIAVLLAFYVQNSKAQSITDYSFEASSGTYTALSGGTTKSLSGGTASSGYFNAIPIGFSFGYMGTNYTTISASTEGWFTFGSNLSASSSTNNLKTGTPRPIVAPLWDDLDLQVNTNMSYKTTGTTGSRVFTIEYKNVQWNASATGSTISFQVKLYEANDKIEFVYRSETGSAYYGSASIGIAGPASNSFLSVYEYNIWFWTITDVSSSNETTDINSKPGTGTTYTFTPPVCTTPSISATVTKTCVGANGGSISANATGGSSPFTYSIDGVNFQASGTFTGLAAGSYTITAKSNTGCVGTTAVTVAANSTASTDNQNTAGNNTWIGHVYDATNFATYMGQTTEAETFTETFGGSATCFNLTSGSGTSSIYTETYSVKYRMNSNKNGLYVANLISDDGSRLTVDGTMVYSNWNDHSLTTSSSVLFNLNGSSSLVLEYYENSGDNQIGFQAPTLVLANTLNKSTNQTICVGNTGSKIEGDVFGTLPAGITLSGTGYQWSYSTTPGGTRTNIAGATAATYTPNASVAPFNTAGTYYIYRNAVLRSTNNVSPNPYTASNESNAAVVKVEAPGTWTGTVNTEWKKKENWACEILPTSTTDVTIPATANQPVIGDDIGYAKNITVQSGASVTVNTVLSIAGAINNSGSINATNGTVEMKGTAAQVIPAAAFTDNTVNNLLISNGVSVSIGGPLKVIDVLAFGNVNNSTLSTNGHLTLVSTATNTASVGDITNDEHNTGNKILGDVTVERYTTSRRSYRFLTAPVNSSRSIKADWMENVANENTAVNYNPNPGYGTHITGKGGSGNGFDATVTNNASMFTFDNQNQAWLGVQNTNGQLRAGSPYRIMIRGSRSTNLNSNDAAASFTTLRAKGSLLTGTVVLRKAGDPAATPGMPVLSAAPNGYSLIANPYASVVDWSDLEKKDISKTIYYYDPTISGTNGRGAYITFNGLLGVVSNLTSKVDNNIQSGQAFFIQTTGANPSLTFEEKHKTTSKKSVFRPADQMANLTVKLLLPRQENTDEAADGFAAYFSEEFDSTIADEDSYKFTNLDENIAIIRNGKTLSIEGRKPVTEADTLPIKIWQLTQTRYSLKVKVANFSENVTAYLEDAYLKSKTVLNNNAETNISFSIDTEPASIATDRFRVVFESFVTLPVHLTGIKASEKSKGVMVDWTAESESNIENYEVERSGDAQQFTSVATVKAKGNAGIAVDYSWFDASPLKGDNYYRIKSHDKSGEVKYSEIVRVNISNAANATAITASGVSSNAIQVSFRNAEKGIYNISLINNAGQMMYSGTISHEGGTSSKVISVNKVMSVGTYNVLLTNDTEKHNLKVWIK